MQLSLCGEVLQQGAAEPVVVAGDCQHCVIGNCLAHYLKCWNNEQHYRNMEHSQEFVPDTHLGILKLILTLLYIIFPLWVEATHNFGYNVFSILD